MTLDGDIYSEMKEASNSLKIIFYCDNVKRWRPNEHGLALNYKLFFAKNIHQSNSNSNVDMKMQPQNLFDRVIEGLTV